MVKQLLLLALMLSVSMARSLEEHYTEKKASPVVGQAQDKY